jgi:hypothetical protein
MALRKEEQLKNDHSLFRVVKDHINNNAIVKRNINKSWKYGYDEKYDIIIISKDGTLGEIYEIDGLIIGLPKLQKDLEVGNNKWVAADYPKELSRIKTVFDWNRYDNLFKAKYIDYIEQEFDRRENGYWFMNNNIPTYITGTHYMYLQWSKIDVGLPDFRESNRIFFIHWAACVADSRSFGQCYLKNRRSGFSFMSSAEICDTATLSRNAKIGIQSKSGTDAKTMFTDKVVPIVNNYPFFFKPLRDGMDNPKSELSFRLPASKITKKNMDKESEADQIDGLDTTIDFKNTADNSYDGEKLLRLVEDEAGKIEKPNNILNGWRVRKTCLRLGSKVIGKCMMGSTSNALSKGGENYKKMFFDSDVRRRSANGQTKSGLYSLFIPMEHNFEGYIDEFGHAVIEDPVKPVVGLDGEMIKIGVLTYWNNEVDALKNDSDALNEFYRQFPRTISHAFRDESKQSLYNLTKIYQQIDYNDSLIKERVLTRGNFSWKNGVLDSEVVFTPENNGRFLVSWQPPIHMRNKMQKDRSGKAIPGNKHLGAFGCDPYDISGVVGGGGSNGALHGKTKFHLESDAPSNEFFLEYVTRTQTAEIFFEDVLMALVYYGMPCLIENNKTRLLYHLKDRGYRNYSVNRPDKHISKLSKTELELGGVPNSSEDMKQAHASAIGSYIEENVGYDSEGTYRDPDEMGSMFFTKTLEDWAKFDINNRTKHDAAISSGLAIMATRQYMFKAETVKPKIIINFARYNNEGSKSQLKR